MAGHRTRWGFANAPDSPSASRRALRGWLIGRPFGGPDIKGAQVIPGGSRVRGCVLINRPFVFASHEVPQVVNAFVPICQSLVMDASGYDSDDPNSARARQHSCFRLFGHERLFAWTSILLPPHSDQVITRPGKPRQRSPQRKRALVRQRSPQTKSRSYRLVPW